MLSNNGLRQCAQYVLLFSVLAVNSDRSQNFTELHTLTLATHSYVLLPIHKLLCTFADRDTGLEKKGMSYTDH